MSLSPSPQRRWKRQDEESSSGANGGADGSEDETDAFDIPQPKKASIERLKRWRVFNEFNCRKPEDWNIFSGITGNYLFMGIIAISVTFQALIVEFLGKFASTVKLTWQLWLASVAVGFVSWPLAFLGKLIPVPSEPFAEYFKWICRCKPGHAYDGGREDDH